MKNTKQLAISVVQKSKDGRIIEAFDNLSQAEKKTGISASSILRCICKLKEQTGKYIWEEQK